MVVKPMATGNAFKAFSPRNSVKIAQGASHKCGREEFQAAGTCFFTEGRARQPSGWLSLARAKKKKLLKNWRKRWASPIVSLFPGFVSDFVSDFAASGSGMLSFSATVAL
jgi:hypothetical protein